MKNTLWVILFVVLALRIYSHFITNTSYSDGTKLRITQVVGSEPVRYERSQYLKLKGYKIYLPLYPEIYYGDEVVVEGVVEGDKLTQAILIDAKEGNNLLYGFRKKLITFYQEALPPKHAALVSGVTIGSKSDIPNDFWEALKTSGTAHVVVASGMNVTLVAGFVMTLLVTLIPRRKAIPLALVLIWLYALMSGFDAPIVRAAVMGSIAFSAQELGKLYYAWRSLFLSGTAMLLAKPEWITDLGFILSFIATLSLMLFNNKIYAWIRRISFTKYVPDFFRRDLATTLAAQIGVAPILYVTFGQFNPLSPLINAAVLWTIPLITVFGMISGFFGLLFEPLGRFTLLTIYPLTSWFVGVIELFT